MGKIKIINGHVKFVKLISIWILLTYVSTTESSECAKDSLIKQISNKVSPLLEKLPGKSTNYDQNLVREILQNHMESESSDNRDRLIKKDKYNFNYQNIKAWNKETPICKKGKMQSPINLQTGSKLQTYKVKESPIKALHFNQKISNGIVHNNGHSVQLKGRWAKDPPMSTGSILNFQTYEFYSIILHWGTEDNNGTEHSINGKKYTLELHIVQRNVKYPNIKEALKEKDGVIVTALLFQENKVKPPNKGIKELAKLACKVSAKDMVAKTDFDITLLDIDSVKSFYTYMGSLTRPPCTENIQWFVGGVLLPIDEESLKLFRSVQLGDNDKSNIRPIQSCRGRKVSFYSVTG